MMTKPLMSQATNQASKLLSVIVFWVLIMGMLAAMASWLVIHHNSDPASVRQARLEVDRLNGHADELEDKYLSKGFLLVAHYTERSMGRRMGYYGSSRTRPAPHSHLCHNEEIFYLNRALKRTSSDNAIFAICWPIYHNSPDHPEVPMG